MLLRRPCLHVVDCQGHHECPEDGYCAQGNLCKHSCESCRELADSIDGDCPPCPNTHGNCASLLVSAGCFASRACSFAEDLYVRMCARASVVRDNESAPSSFESAPSSFVSCPCVLCVCVLFSTPSRRLVLFSTPSGRLGFGQLFQLGRLAFVVSRARGNWVVCQRFPCAWQLGCVPTTLVSFLW